MNLGACPRIHDAVIPAVFKPESMIRKSFFGAGLDSGLKLAGMTIDTIRPIIGQAPNQNENCCAVSRSSYRTVASDIQITSHFASGIAHLCDSNIA